MGCCVPHGARGKRAARKSKWPRVLLARRKTLVVVVPTAAPATASAWGCAVTHACLDREQACCNVPSGVWRMTDPRIFVSHCVRGVAAIVQAVHRAALRARLGHVSSPRASGRHEARSFGRMRRLPASCSAGSAASVRAFAWRYGAVSGSGNGKTDWISMP